MYILFILVSILTFVNAAPQRYCLTGERFYCCESLKNPTFFSKVENTGKNAGAVGWNCTKADVHDTYAVKQCSHHPTCCSGESEVDGSATSIHGCNHLGYYY